MSTGGMSLGASTFTVRADTAPFEQGMRRVEAMARHGAETTKSAFSGLGSNMMIVAQSLDDLQYGLRAITNNVPQLGMALGSALGIGTQGALAMGGALGAAAVAVNVLSSHWSVWFGEAQKLPEIKGGLDELGEALGRIKEQLDPLRDAMREFREGNRGVFGEMADQMGFGAASLKNRLRAGELQGREAEARARIGNERAFQGLGASDTERGNAAAFKKAMAALPGGKEQLLGTLMARGMSREDAMKAIAGAAGGNAGFAGDILGKLTAGEKRGAFRGFALALPGERRKGELMAGISAGMGEDEEAAAGRRKERDDRTRRLMRANEEQMADEEKARAKAARERERRADQAGGFLSRSPLAAAMFAGGLNARQQGQIRDRIGRMLGGAGFGDVGRAEAFAEMREQMQEKIGQIMLSRNVDERTARRIAMEDVISQNMEPEEQRRKGVQANFVGLADFAKSTQLGIFNAQNPQRTMTEQLRVQEKMRDLLDEIARGGNVAVAAGPP